MPAGGGRDLQGQALRGRASRGGDANRDRAPVCPLCPRPTHLHCTPRPGSPAATAVLLENHVKKKNTTDVNKQTGKFTKVPLFFSFPSRVTL